jgi:hypothetical protein
MPLSDRLRVAWACRECRRYRRLALAFAALYVGSWLIL